MENINNVIKITYAKNLEKINFNSVISTPIDSNANIKSILNVASYLFDTKVECGNGKAIISGKVGIKVVYLDTDNLTNTISDSQSFSETFTHKSITNDCCLNIFDNSILNTILSTDGILKISCDISISPIMYLNIALNNNSNFDGMIIKKSEVETNSISQIINTSFDYTLNFETKDNISKILHNQTLFTPTNVTAQQDVAIVEGKLYSSVLYETIENEETKIKQLTDVFVVKYDLALSGLSTNDTLDLSFLIDPSKEKISSDCEDDGNVITISNTICVCGVATKVISIDVVDDLYSLTNDLELSSSSRDYTKSVQTHCLTENVAVEIALNNSEPAIDEVVSNLNIVAEITNTYIKNEQLFIEGIVTSNLNYVDENKIYQQKPTEMPFIINTKINLTSLPCVHSKVTVCDCKIKVKRGTIIDLEYLLGVSVCLYEKETKEIIDNVIIGKPLNFSNYDYQIFLARENETMWEICKRIKTTPDELNKYNKNLPLVFAGKEKVIIKR